MYARSLVTSSKSFAFSSAIDTCCVNAFNLDSSSSVNPPPTLLRALNKVGGGFTDEDESRLKAFTQQVSIALENAKLFEDVTKERAYNHSMLASMSNGVITINEEGVIATCNKAKLCCKWRLLPPR